MNDKRMRQVIEPTLDKEWALKIWEKATPLGIAWLRFGDDRHKRLQIQAKGTPASIVIQRSMTADIFARLAAGKLEAYGHRILPTPSEGPVQIPRHTFGIPDVGRWLQDIVEVSGWRYERVRIEQPITNHVGVEEPADDCAGAIETGSIGATADEPEGLSLRPAMGRPPNHEKLCEIVRELRAAEAFVGKLVREREGLVRELARQRHPNRFPKPSQPSRNSILAALDAEGCRSA